MVTTSHKTKKSINLDRYVDICSTEVVIPELYMLIFIKHKAGMLCGNTRLRGFVLQCGKIACIKLN